MLSAEEQIQKALVSLDVGRLANWLWRAVFLFVALGLSVFYLSHEFRGLPVPESMDQAQIGREILRGNGWQTKFVRPLAIGELRSHGRDVQTALWHDTYNAPIPPLLDAAAIYLPVTNDWSITKTTLVYSADKAIAMMEVIFFLLAVLVLYFIAKELFDQRLAYMAAGLVLACDMMWKYALTGLPQMFLLLLLHLTVLALLRAMRARNEERPHLGWAAAVGAGFGLMALTHATTIFIFFPVLVFSCIRLRPRWAAAALMLAVFLLIYTPWLVRTAMVCGDFRGMAGFAGLDGIVRSEAGHMRRFAIDLGETSGNYYAANFRLNLMAQFNRLFEYFGLSCVAPVALVSVLHAFRRPVTATFRWLLFLMWGGAVCGMAVFGMKESRGYAANQFHLLFLPLFICYGMAFILVQWDRRIGLGFVAPAWSKRAGVHYFLRRSMVIAVFLLSSIPLLMRMFLGKQGMPFEWPPYAPMYIARIGQWYEPDEIIGSDMPWAVAWYADRRSLWLPYEPKDLYELSDYQKLGAPVGALFFTPVSGTQNLVDDLVNGEYKNWTDYIVRTIDPAKTPYPVRELMGSHDSILFMDRDRRTPAE